MHRILLFMREQAVSPPDDVIQRNSSIHYHQVDHNRVLSGEQDNFELVNFDWKFPYHIVKLDRRSGALVIPVGTYHRSISR